MLNIVLFGAPGAGKGTQSANIIDKYNLIHISTGDVLRAEMKAGTELGLKAKSLIDNGKLVPDSVVIGIIENKINENKNSNGFIFDGFPRTVAQAEALDDLLNNIGSKIDMMIALDVKDTELKKRLLERGKVSGRADDQNEDKINTRIDVYKLETLPVAEYYNDQNKYSKISGIGSIDTIFSDICSTINKVK